MAVGTLLLVEAYPRTLHIDEATLLYEARRIFAGDVPYRDYFTFFSPGSEWLIAQLFRVFGPTFATARHAMAVLHGLIAAGVFLIARSVGARPAVALAAAVVHPAVAMPQYAAATPHWFGTALLLALVGCLVRLQRHDWRAGGLVIGALAGVLLVTELPKGVVAIAGTSVVLLAGGRATGRPMGHPFLDFILALFVVAGVMALVLGLSAALEPTFQALVKVPLGHYHESPQNRWAMPNLLPPLLTSPLEPHPGVTAIVFGVTAWLPWLMVISIARAMLVLVRTGSVPPIRLVLAGGGVMALGAVSYNPNPVHVATILPVLTVLGAEASERGLSRLERGGWRFVSWVPVAVVAVLAVQAIHFPPCLQRNAPEEVDTAFGRLDGGAGAREAQAAQQAAFAATSGTVFVYPACPGLYLTAGLSNPTRFQIFYPQHDPPEHLLEAVTSLDRLQAPFFFRCWTWFRLPPDDPVLRYVQEHYESTGRVPGGWLFRRKGAVHDGPGRP